MMIRTVTPELTLRPLQPDDAADIFHTIDTQREYLGRWLPFVPHTRTLNNSQDFIRSVLELPDEAREETYTIRSLDRFAGLIGFKNTDRNNRKTEIGYWLSKPFQHRGLVTQSVTSLLQRAFEELTLNRVQIKCAVGNDRSRAIPRRLGFTFEGIERHGELFAENNYADIEVYSILRGEWNP